MSRIPPLRMEELPADLGSILQQISAQMGFSPNDALIMARHPALLRALTQLIEVGYLHDGELPAGVKNLVALTVSLGAGCNYCSTHVAAAALHKGMSAQKLCMVNDYLHRKTADRKTADPKSADYAGMGSESTQRQSFTEAEKVAIDTAYAARRDELEDAHFTALHKHFSMPQIMELLGIICIFSFLNRWNQMLGTAIEPEAALQAEAVREILPGGGDRAGQGSGEAQIEG